MKKVDFLFQYEVKARELDSICLLAAYLKNKGYTVAFINSWDSMWKRPRTYRTNVLVVSACYNDSAYDCFTGLAGAFKKVVNMQWEQVLTNRCYMQSDNNPWAYTGVALEIKHACWGEKQVQILRRNYAIPKENLTVVGYLPLDFYREELKEQIIPRDILFKRYGLDVNKKTLLFISSFSLVELPETEKQEGNVWFDEQTLQDTKTRREILDWFDRFASENQDIQIIYRYHPAEKNSKAVENVAKKNKNVFLISDEAIRHWILACDKIYNWISTSMIEIYYSKKDVYILRPTSVAYEADMSIFENAEVICSYEEFERSVFEEKMQKFPIPERDLLQWYDCQEKPAYERYGDWLIQTYMNNQYSSRKSKYNIHKNKIQKAIKSRIKKTKSFQGLITRFECAGFDGKIGKKIKQISMNINQKKKSFDEMNSEDSYMNQKRMANYASEEEINRKISQYQALIKKR